jgi:phosphotriesterase-related protein
MSIMTVNGEIETEQLGITLPHEHLFIDFRMIYEPLPEQIRDTLGGDEINLNNLHVLKHHPYSIVDNLIIENEELVVSEVMEFQKAGGSSIVDQTPIGLKRYPEMIKKVAEATGLNIIVGCGFYVKESLSEELLGASEKNLEEQIMRDITVGIEGTPIKPGVIGEIGISNELGEWEEKVFRVVGRVYKETGLPVSIHIQAVPTLPGYEGALLGLDALRKLDKFGVDLGKVVICHTDAQVNMEYIRGIVETGAYAEFDHVGKEFYIESRDFQLDSDTERMAALKQLIEAGYTNRLLISQDVCLKTDLMAYGGYGYAHVLRDLVPYMRKMGISDKAIDTILIRNPMNWLNIAK